MLGINDYNLSITIDDCFLVITVVGSPRRNLIKLLILILKKFSLWINHRIIRSFHTNCVTLFSLILRFYLFSSLNFYHY